jgi:hypothetical protein
MGLLTANDIEDEDDDENEHDRRIQEGRDQSFDAANASSPVSFSNFHALSPVGCLSETARAQCARVSSKIFTLLRRYVAVGYFHYLTCPPTQPLFQSSSSSSSLSIFDRRSLTEVCVEQRHACGCVYSLPMNRGRGRRRERARSKNRRGEGSIL